MINIVELLNEIIEKYSAQVAEISKRKEEIFEKINVSTEKREELKKNSNNIVSYSDEEIMNIINSIELDGELLIASDIDEVLYSEEFEKLSTRKRMLSLILQIKYLTKLEPNIEYTAEQLEAVEKIVNDFIITVKILNEELSKVNVNEKEVTEKMNRVKLILDKISNPDSRDLVTDYDTIEEIVKTSNLDESQKIDFIFGMLEHNVKAFNASMNDMIPTPYSRSSRKKEVVLLDESAVDAILQKYGFSTQKLIINGDRKYLDLLLKNGNLKNMDEVLDLLINTYGFASKFKLSFSSEEGIKIIVSLLVRGDAGTIAYMVSLFRYYGIDDIEIFNKPAMLFRSKEDQIEDESEEAAKGETILEYGVAGNVIKNIEFFQKKNFDVGYMLDRALALFGNSPRTIEYNYKIFDMYALPFIVHQVARPKCASAFKANHAEDILDRMLEIGPEAYHYATVTCMSRLLMAEPNHEAIYDLYKNNKIVEDLRKLHRLDTEHKYAPEVKLDCKESLDMYYIDSEDHKTQEEKNKIAGTIVPPIKNREVYDVIVASKLEERKKKYYKNEIDFNKGNIFFDYDLITDDVYTQRLEKKYGTVPSEDGKTDKSDFNLQVYNIDGVYISKIKFLKVYEALKDEITDENREDIILYALTYKSIISKEDFIKVQGAVRDLMKVKKGVIK